MKSSCSLLDRVAAFMAGVCPGQEPGVVAVSGGPDSVALLRLLVELQNAGTLGPLTVAHLNHQLRGQDSDADEEFAHYLAKELALPFHSRRVNVAELARGQGENLESTARQVRYDCLTEIAVGEGAAWVATGHTADDQAETLLHRLVRGTGLHGLGGIPSRRTLAHEIEVIRPLLGTSRTEVLAYLQDIKQTFRTDPSNWDLGFTRNRIRHELLPALVRDYNPAIVSVLCRLAEQAREVQSLVATQAAELLKETELPRAGNLRVFNKSRLTEAPRHLVREMFRLVWSRENWPVGAMTFEDWDRLADLAWVDNHGIDLPDRLHARSADRVIQIGLFKAP